VHRSPGLGMKVPFGDVEIDFSRPVAAKYAISSRSTSGCDIDDIAVSGEARSLQIEEAAGRRGRGQRGLRGHGGRQAHRSTFVIDYPLSVPAGQHASRTSEMPSVRVVRRAGWNGQPTRLNDPPYSMKTSCTASRRMNR